MSEEEVKEYRLEIDTLFSEIRTFLGDSAFVITLKCGEPLHKEVINTGYGKGGQIVSEWYYPMKNGWYGVLTIRAGKLIRIGTIQAK